MRTGGIGRWSIERRAVVWSRWWKMLKFAKCLLDVAVHGKDAGAIIVVPFKVDANVLFCLCITLDGIMLAHGCQQMFKVFVLVIFDDKIINNKGEGDVLGLVKEITFDEVRFLVADDG